jgi:hypothetical protein
MEYRYFHRIIRLLENRPRAGKRLLGIGEKVVMRLLDAAEKQDKTRRKVQANRPDRKRAPGAGTKPAPLLFQLLTTLLYMRQHPTMQMLSEWMGCSESTVWNYIHAMLPVIRADLPASLLEGWKRENPNMDQADLERFLADVSGEPLIVDAWEQERLRPKDDEKQKACYSGKKKRHTRKNQVIVTQGGTDIVDVVFGEEGRRFDGKIFQENQDRLPDSIQYEGDKAYQGQDRMTTPFKVPPKGELTDEQRAFNRDIGERRIFVEHKIREIRLFRIAGETFRMADKMYNTVMGGVCGLVRVRQVQCVQY